MRPKHPTHSPIPELLAPAGTMDAFKAALAAGADAVYCGLGQLNARRNAENLTIETFSEACRMAHLAGSRVYVTLNVLIREDELGAALKLVHDCAAAGADGFIFQDWGLVRLVRELWPDLELHLSTQANVHDPHGVRFAVRHGLSRVTLSRELSLSEIEACSHEGAELEIFGHGALCVCYSGECLLSSMQRGRSANRGLCRQPCRLPYRLLDEKGAQVARVNGTRLLSPRDNCTIDDIAALARAGCGALKIEGRMKAPDYVGTVVASYRRAIDDLGHGQDPAADAPVMRALARAFNRDFTDAYLHGRSDNAMMSFERGNNRGQLAGRVTRIDRHLSVLGLTEPVGQGDLLEIRNPDRFEDYVTVPAPQACEAGHELAVRLPRPMEVGCPVRVIRSEEGMARAREYAARLWPRKRAVKVRVVARIGRPFCVELQTLPGDGHPALGGMPVTGSAEGFTVERARTRPVHADELVEHVGRLGASPFEAVLWDVELDDGAGMGFSAVHAVRAQAVAALEEALTTPWQKRTETLLDAPCSVPSRPPAPIRPKTAEPLVCALVTNPAAAHGALEAGASVVYAPVEDLVLGPGSSGRPWDDAGGFRWPEGVVPVLGEISRSREQGLFSQVLRDGAPVVCGTVGWLDAAVEQGALPWLWHTLPVHNHAAAQELEEAGAHGMWLSPELELLEIEALAKGTSLELGIVVSGHIRTMTTEHCLLQSLGACNETCGTCARRRGRYTLRDEFDRPSLVTSDALGRSRLWWPSPLDLTPQIPELGRIGVTRFMVDAQLMDVEQTARAVRRAVRALEDGRSGKVPTAREPGATSGHLFERIG